MAKYINSEVKRLRHHGQKNDMNRVAIINVFLDRRRNRDRSQMTV
jgi:hypothetical protein